jgi:nucleoside-diphosphate-sugar epimerase
MRTLITGGCGFIGFALAKKLFGNLKGGDEIILLDNLHRHGLSDEIQDFVSLPKVKHLNIDISGHEIPDELSIPFNRVYHLAAIVGVGPVTDNPAHVLRSNTVSTLNIFEAFERNAVDGARLLFSSSSEIYSGLNLMGYDLPIPTPEKVPAVISNLDHPRFSYALSKMWGEAYAKYISRKDNMHLSSVRYHNVYGPGMGFDHVVPQIISRILSKEDPFKIIGAEQTRSFCWVEDAAEATRLIMESEKNEPGTSVHIGDQDGETKIGNVYEMLFDLCGWKPGKTEKVESPTGSVSRRCPDTTLMQSLTGYKPQVSLYDGLKKTVEWYKMRLMNIEDN